MNRRKPDNVTQNRREGWTSKGGSSQRGLFSRRTSLQSNKNEEASVTETRGLFTRRSSLQSCRYEDASATEPSSGGSSMLDFDLPKWEKPQNAVSRDKYDRLPSPMKTRPQSRETHGYVMPQQLSHDSAKKFPPQQNQRQHQSDERFDHASDELTDMVVMCNSSFNSFSDDITLMSCFHGDEEQVRAAQKWSQAKKKPDPPESRHALVSSVKPLVKSSVHDETDPRFGPPRRLDRSNPLVDGPPPSPKGTKAFVWKKAPNGRFMKVSVDGDTTPGTTEEMRGNTVGEDKDEDEEERLRLMEEEMLQQAIELSKNFEEHSIHSTATARIQGSNPAFAYIDSSSSVRSTARTHEARVDCARSVENSSARAATGDTEFHVQEEALVQLAMERSMRDVTSSITSEDRDSSRPISSLSARCRSGTDLPDRRSLYASAHRLRKEEGANGDHVVFLGDSNAAEYNESNARAGFFHQAPSSPRREAKNFVWKKGPNNRYIKCPIAMDQLDEDRAVEKFATESSGMNGTPSSGEDRLSRMEEAMVEEAMKRSMRDLYAGL